MFTFKESEFEFSMVVEEGEGLEEVCDTDGWVTIPGQGSWGASFLTIQKLQEKLALDLESGDRASGSYFATPGLVMLREPGVENILLAVRHMVETELYRFVLVKQVDNLEE